MHICLLASKAVIFHVEAERERCAAHPNERGLMAGNCGRNMILGAELVQKKRRLFFQAIFQKQDLSHVPRLVERRTFAVYLAISLIFLTGAGLGEIAYRFSACHGTGQLLLQPGIASLLPGVCSLPCHDGKSNQGHSLLTSLLFASFSTIVCGVAWSRRLHRLILKALWPALSPEEVPADPCMNAEAGNKGQSRC